MTVNIPERVYLGNHSNAVVGYLMLVYKNFKAGEVINKHASRRVLGFALPDFQRGVVWNEQMQISFIESVWKGVPIGTYSINIVCDDDKFDGLVIDGQQRLTAIQRYVDDEFPVFGGFFSELDNVQKRRWNNSTFGSYITDSTDEAFLRNYYNTLNYGGVAHKENERA